MSNKTQGFEGQPLECSYCGRKDAPYYWIHTEHDIVACSFCLTLTKEDKVHNG